MIIETFRQALQNVWSNKLRTFLTMLGIIIGVMAVIVIVGLGNGMTQSMRDSFSALGTNALSIQVWGYGSRTASVEDVYKIADKNKELISAVSPQIDFRNNTPKVGTTTYRYGTSVYGVDEHYAEMKNYTLAQGRGLQYMDIKDNKQVCIIGDYLNRAAYGGNAVGQTIKLGAYKFRIVGVLNAKVTDKNLQQGSDDDCIYLPYTTAMRLSNQSSAKNFVAIMKDESRANEAKAVVESGLYDLLKSDNAYYIYSASEWLEEMNEMINMVIIILTGIASISLLVGGIGSGQRQHGGPAVHHAERDGQQPAGCSERCGHPRCTGPDAGVLLHLPRERGLSGHGGHPVHRPARHFALCPLCPHCGAERLDERLHRRLFPARQCRDTGRSGHGHPQADGL